MPARHSSGSRALRLVLLLGSLGTAGSCGGGSDLSGPPTGPPDPPAVASVEVAPAAVNLAIEGTVQLVATPRAANDSALTDRSVAWSTSDAAVAAVSATGVVTGVAAGEATITATSEGKTGTATVTVSDLSVATVEVTPSPSSVTLGQTAQFIAVPRAANGDELVGRPVAWSTSDPGVATVNESGLVSGVAVGSATITATSEGKTGTSLLTVSTVPVATVEVTPAAPSVPEGVSVQLTATAKDANGAPLPGRAATWATSNAAVARVSATGRVTGVAAGSATITATIEGKSGSADVTVAPATGIVRTWKGGANAKPTDWSAPANWTPAGKPIVLDTVRVPATSNTATLSEDVQIAQLVVAGGQVRTAGHRLQITKPN